MASFKLLLAIAVVACCLVQLHEAQTCTATSSITTCQIPVTFYDHAPAWMAHSRWNPQWWNVKAFYDYPYNGSCGTANNTHGWANSDFELPLFVLQGPAVCCSTAQFNLPIINGEKGLAGQVCTSATDQSSTCGRLGADQTPQYAYSGQSPYGEVSSPQSFYTFFHNVEQTFPVPFNLTLTQDPTQTNLRSFNNFSFFPLDGLGWNDYSSSYDVNGNFQKHNYAFCMVMNTHFTYGGGEYFDFLGDDDVYAYINGFLVMDLGGVHTALNASIQADNLGLTKQTTYRFDLFYCERHTTSSEIKFSTTINFFCAYNDWCGVCDGNGQSCCDGACNDTNLCTTDTCGVQVPPPNGCVHTPVSCPPSTPCINSFCDPNTGNCVTTQVNCSDGNACTTDTCGSSGCVHTPISCASANQCVTTGCNPATGCTTQPVSCTTSNKCQNSTCVSNVGCINNNIPCSTTNKCYTATCTPSSGCQITPNAPCNDNNQCTTDSCNPQTGCVFTPNNISSQCGVSDKCTQYYCNPQTGCGSTKTVCTSPDACHTAVCVPSTGCQILPNVTCTGNACGTSACNPTTGACVYTPNAPCAPKTCYNATCNNSTGCQYSAATCTPTQACYSGVCVNNQCNFTYTQGAPGCGNCGTATCNVSDPCNPQVCQNGKCVNQPVNCNDYNACTNDTCVGANGKAQCLNTPIVCNSGNPCNPQSCSPVNGTCISNPVICNDGNPCTTDECVVSGSSYTCNFPAIQCNATSDPFCNPVECQNGTCVNAPPPNCSDGNACTYDQCTNGSCSNPPVCPSAGTLCDPITCINGTCVTQPVNCSSGNLCSIDSCDPTTGNCLHIPKNCNGTICSPSSCNLTTGQCEVPQLLNCNAGNNPCTLGTRTCDPILGFGCNYTDLSYECDSHSACILDFCNSSMTTATNTSQACYHQNVNCTAPTICQVVAGCNAVNGCVYTPKICPAPLNKCMVAICDEIAGCLTVDKACAPQDNFCYAGTCNNLTGVCGQVQRPNWQVITNQQGVTCLLAYNTAAKAGLTAGIIAAIVIAAVVAAALIAIAGKKGVDVFLASRAAPIGAASNNPLYVQTAGAGENALYAGR